jgi:hypothetical protein
MVWKALSKRIHGVIGLMLIYGNTPSDIRKMMWRRKFKLLAIAVLIVVAVTLMGCTVGNKKVNPPLMALDKFWETLGSGVDKTKEIKKDSAEVE